VPQEEIIEIKWIDWIISQCFQPVIYLYLKEKDNT
jgi:hypothetical protein